MELASADVAAGIFSSEALERNRLGCLGPGWVEVFSPPICFFDYLLIISKRIQGSGAVHCCCHKCDGTAIGCKRRSIKHIIQMVYCAGDEANPEIVPLTGILWRVAWKAHVFDPQKQSQAFFNHAEEAIVIQSVVRDIANTREKINGIIQLADSW